MRVLLASNDLSSVLEKAQLLKENDRFRLNHLLIGAADHTKALVVVPVVGRVPIAVRRPAVLRVVVPATTPVHSVRAHGRSHPVFLTHNCEISSFLFLQHSQTISSSQFVERISSR